MLALTTEAGCIVGWPNVTTRRCPYNYRIGKIGLFNMLEKQEKLQLQILTKKLFNEDKEVIKAAGDEFIFAMYGCPSTRNEKLTHDEYRFICFLKLVHESDHEVRLSSILPT